MSSGKVTPSPTILGNPFHILQIAKILLLNSILGIRINPQRPRQLQSLRNSGEVNGKERSISSILALRIIIESRFNGFRFQCRFIFNPGLSLRFYSSYSSDVTWLSGLRPEEGDIVRNTSSGEAGMLTSSSSFVLRSIYLASHPIAP